MNSLEDIMGFIHTEAVEHGGDTESPDRLPPIRYDLELIEDNDGTVRWEEKGHGSMTCRECEMLLELFELSGRSPREYWLMTELFVLLHGGKDYCGRGGA